MRKIIGFLLAILSILALPGCVRQQASGDPVDYAGATLSVGKGGGFAGTVREYRLLDSGELFVREPNETNFQFVKKKKPRKAKSWFERLEAMDFAGMDYQNPGNVYQYISVKKGDVTHRVTWSGGDSAVPAGVTDFYADFMKAWVSKK